MTIHDVNCFLGGTIAGMGLTVASVMLGDWLGMRMLSRGRLTRKRRQRATTGHPWPCDDPEQARRFAYLVDRLRAHDRMESPTPEQIENGLRRIREAATRYRRAVIEAGTDDAVRLLELGRTWEALEELRRARS